MAGFRKHLTKNRKPRLDSKRRKSKTLSFVGNPRIIDTTARKYTDTAEGDQIDTMPYLDVGTKWNPDRDRVEYSRCFIQVNMGETAPYGGLAGATFDNLPKNSTINEALLTLHCREKPQIDSVYEIGMLPPETLVDKANWNHYQAGFTATGEPNKSFKWVGDDDSDLVSTALDDEVYKLIPSISHHSGIQSEPRVFINGSYDWNWPYGFNTFIESTTDGDVITQENELPPPERYNWPNYYTEEGRATIEYVKMTKWNEYGDNPENKTHFEIKMTPVDDDYSWQEGDGIEQSFYKMMGIGPEDSLIFGVSRVQGGNPIYSYEYEVPVSELSYHTPPDNDTWVIISSENSQHATHTSLSEILPPDPNGVPDLPQSEQDIDDFRELISRDPNTDTLEPVTIRVLVKRKVGGFVGRFDGYGSDGYWPFSSGILYKAKDESEVGYNAGTGRATLLPLIPLDDDSGTDFELHSMEFQSSQTNPRGSLQIFHNNSYGDNFVAAWTDFFKVFGLDYETVEQNPGKFKLIMTVQNSQDDSVHEYTYPLGYGEYGSDQFRPQVGSGQYGAGGRFIFRGSNWTPNIPQEGDGSEVLALWGPDPVIAFTLKQVEPLEGEQDTHLALTTLDHDTLNEDGKAYEELTQNDFVPFTLTTDMEVNDEITIDVTQFAQRAQTLYGGHLKLIIREKYWPGEVENEGVEARVLTEEPGEFPRYLHFEEGDFGNHNASSGYLRMWRVRQGHPEDNRLRIGIPKRGGNPTATTDFSSIMNISNPDTYFWDVNSANLPFNMGLVKTQVSDTGEAGLLANGNANTNPMATLNSLLMWIDPNTGDFQIADFEWMRTPNHPEPYPESSEMRHTVVEITQDQFWVYFTFDEPNGYLLYQTLEVPVYGAVPGVWTPPEGWFDGTIPEANDPNGAKTIDGDILFQVDNSRGYVHLGDSVNITETPSFHSTENSGEDENSVEDMGIKFTSENGYSLSVESSSNEYLALHNSVAIPGTSITGSRIEFGNVNIPNWFFNERYDEVGGRQFKLVNTNFIIGDDEYNFDGTYTINTTEIINGVFNIYVDETDSCFLLRADGNQTDVVYDFDALGPASCGGGTDGWEAVYPASPTHAVLNGQRIIDISDVSQDYPNRLNFGIDIADGVGAGDVFEVDGTIELEYVFDAFGTGTNAGFYKIEKIERGQNNNWKFYVEKDDGKRINAESNFGGAKMPRLKSHILSPKLDVTFTYSEEFRGNNT